MSSLFSPPINHKPSLVRHSPKGDGGTINHSSLKALDKWLPGYVASVWRRPGRVEGTRHLLFCVADHFEPLGRGGDEATAGKLVREWARAYPGQFASFRDAAGRPPRHTFFYPAEEYRPECLGALVPLCSGGHGEVEIHLHHRHDTADGLREKLSSFRDTLSRRHGLLGRDSAGKARYGFVHGNWALCNSRPDGDWCGVNEEIGILADTGCYADFTFPSAPSPTQPRMVNAIYRACDTPGRPRAHDTGTRVTAGRGTATGSLLMIQGPLGLDWQRRKHAVLPRIENADLTEVNPPSAVRANLWVKQHIHVLGRPEWVFVKVHTHGCVPQNMRMLLGGTMRNLHSHLQSRYNDGLCWRLHYVTAREMANIARAAEDGQTGDPGLYRDYEVLPCPGVVPPA